jgi:hypothetical protein
MKTHHTLLSLFSFAGLLVASPVWAVRDPFWPIGYSPAPPAPEVNNAERVRPVPPAEKQKPEPPRIKPVSEEDWSKARQALSISGVTRTVKPDTNETRTLAMINRQTFSIGDTITLAHADIRFQWRLVSIEGNDIKLEPIRAERIAPKNTDLKLR